VAGQSRPEPRADERPEATGREDQPDGRRGEVQVADQDQHQRQDEDLVEQVERRRLADQRPDVAIAERDAEPLADLVTSPPRADLGRSRQVVRYADPTQAQGGNEEPQRVRDHGQRRRDGLDEKSAESTTADLVGRLGRGDLAVGVDQDVLRHETRQQGEVRHLIEHREGRDAEDRDAQQLETRDTGPHGDRDARHEDEPPEVGPHHEAEPSRASPVDEQTERQRGQQERQKLREAHGAELGGIRGQRHECEQRYGDLGDLRSQGGRARPDPQSPEVRTRPRPIQRLGLRNLCHEATGYE